MLQAEASGEPNRQVNVDQDDGVSLPMHHPIPIKPLHPLNSTTLPHPLTQENFTRRGLVNCGLEHQLKTAADAQIVSGPCGDKWKLNPPRTI